MKRGLKVIEDSSKTQVPRGPYEEIAFYVRQLLDCDYALVALTEKDSIRVQGFAGGEGATNGGLAEDLILQLRDWGPVIIDEARVVAVPVSSGDHVLGVLIGYSHEPGTFTSAHLEKLTAYAPVAVGMMATVAVEMTNESKATFSPDELFHFFRLITIGEFSACFAHEVRNPLTLIQGHLRFINENLTADHPMRTNVEAIDRASRRIEDMAKRMLDFSKKRTCHPETCDLPELISDALRFVQPYIQAMLINVEAHFDPHLPPIEVDRWQMLQAIVNILQNASDAMANAQSRVLSIDAILNESRVEIVISDTGTGIAKANLSRIFDPFFTTKNERGTGLGLYITKQVIEEHRGNVRVETSNQGTSFTISLPLYSGNSGSDV